MVEDKITYPKLLGIEESRSRATALIEKAKSVLKPWEDSAVPLLALADYITNRDR